MSNPVIALLLAVGIGVWVYSKMHKRTMGNNQVSGIVGLVVGLIVLLIAWTALNLVISN